MKCLVEFLFDYDILDFIITISFKIVCPESMDDSQYSSLDGGPGIKITADNLPGGQLLLR